MDPLVLFRNEPDAMDVEAGAIIFREEDEAEAMFVVLEGRVNVVIRQRAVATLGPGEIFGEMALIERKPRNAMAVALTRCRLAVVGEKRFLFLVQHHPFFSLYVMRVLASRLRLADAMLAD